MSRAETDANAACTGGVNAGRAAFIASRPFDEAAGIEWRTGWLSGAREARERLAALGPLGDDGAAREIRAALEAAQFSLKNHASAKLRADDERKLGDARFKVTAALALFPPEAEGRPPAVTTAPRRRHRRRGTY